MAERNGEVAVDKRNYNFGYAYLGENCHSKCNKLMTVAVALHNLNQQRQMQTAYEENSFCPFCKNNGERKAFYIGHNLRDEYGRVKCPVLRAYTCPYCGATGDVAHTAAYCKYQPIGAQSVSLAVKKSVRNSTGVRRGRRNK